MSHPHPRGRVLLLLLLAAVPAVTLPCVVDGGDPAASRPFGAAAPAAAAAVASVASVAPVAAEPVPAAPRAALALPPAAVGRTRHDLAGRVLDAGSGAPVTRFLLACSPVGQRVGRPAVRRAVDGGFCIRGLPAGRYSVVVQQAAADVAVAAEVELPQRSPLVLRIGGRGRILGRVVDGHGQPLAGAPVRAVGPAPARGRSAAGGDFALPVAAPGDYRVEVVGWPAAAHRVVVPAAGDATAELRLAGAAELHVQVHDRAGAPLGDAAVLVWSRAGLRRRAVTAADGRATLRALPAGRYVLHLDHPACRAEQRGIDVLARRVTAAVIELRARR